MDILVNIMLLLTQNIFNNYNYKFINKNINNTILNTTKFNNEIDNYFDKKLNYI